MVISHRFASLARLLLAGSGASLLAAAPLQWEASAGWESHYMNSGRRVLDAPGGLYTATLAAAGESVFFES